MLVSEKRLYLENIAFFKRRKFLVLLFVSICILLFNVNH